MQCSSSTRRTQFSSCDACRKSRVACDASKEDQRLNRRGRRGSCSRCSARNRVCTFEWIKKSSARRLREGSGSRAVPSVTGSSLSTDHAALITGSGPSTRTVGSHVPDERHYHGDPSSEVSVPESEPRTIDMHNPDNQSTELLATQWSKKIFHLGFGAIFGRSVGRNGCPFVNDPICEISVPPLSLYSDLDVYMDKQLDSHPSSTFATSAKREEMNHQIEQCLHRAIQSFTARWIPAVTVTTSDMTYQEIIKERWRSSRIDMLKVINHMSYRSVLTLYLFGQTPVPSGISEDEEMNGISSLVCSQTAILKLQQLRERLRSCRFNYSKVSASSDIATNSTANPNITQAFLDLESRAYWAAVTWDTSSSVTLNFRSSLTSGLRGACLEPAWRLARGFLVGSFHAKSEEWCKKDSEVSDETAPEIISAAAVCTQYTWKTIASVKEALREGVEESDTLFAWNAFLDTLDVFQTIIHPLLSACERRLHFLGQVDRLNWYSVMLQYHLGILILADAIEAANRLDLFSIMAKTKLSAEQESFNLLTFGLESRYTMYEPSNELHNASDVDSTDPSLGNSVITSFIAIDPYPNHVIASVRLISKAISYKYRQGNIKREVYSHLSSTLLKVLEQLPKSSKSVRSAYASLREELRVNSISTCDV